MAPDRTRFPNIPSVLDVPCTVHILPDADDVTVSYTSVITDYDETSFYLTTPSKGALDMPLRDGDTIRVVYYGEDAMYRFTARITGSQGQHGDRRYAAALPEECWRVQRRASYRLRSRIDAEYRAVDEGTDALGDPNPCLVTDISGDGIGFLVDDALRVGSSIEVSFSFEGPRGSARIRERVRVVRVESARGGDGKTYARRCGGFFSAIDQRSKNHILRLIFLKQVESLTKNRR